MGKERVKLEGYFPGKTLSSGWAGKERYRGETTQNT